MSNGRILVTGGSGFIGSRIVLQLLAHGIPVRILTRNPNALTHHHMVEPFHGDLAVPESLEGIEADIAGVIHCAGALGRWGVPASELHAINTAAPLALLERFCEQFRRRNGGRFILVSGGGVSGPLGTMIGDETTPCCPATAYEKTKYQAETALIERAESLSMDVVVVRPTFTYGPDDPHKLPLFKRIRDRRFLFIGDGNALIHPVHVNDAARGILLAREKGRSGEIYIIGGREPVSWLQLTTTLSHALGVPPPRWHIPEGLSRMVAGFLEFTAHRLPLFEPLLTRGRILMVNGGYGYSIDKAINDLKYHPNHTLEDGIVETVASYQRMGWL
ncbi:MAG: NAD-dependent epimerase/dehydratase family protein [Magnetococcales bacterium]|nr:NAD-dependent epimerase/dehydratase family protein [Magnetococcales bacterium]